MHKRPRTGWLLLPALTCLIPPLYAAGIAGIGNATINEGQLVVHVREAFGTDNDQDNLDNRWRQRLMLDYGFTDWFASGIYIQGDKRENRDMELEALIWDSRFELTTVERSGYYSGFRLRYTYMDGDKKPDNFHIRGIIGMPYGKWDLRLNPILYTDVGPEARSGIGVDMRARVTYEYIPNHHAGFESYHNHGKLRDINGYRHTSHDMGVVFAGNVSPEWSYETGYAYGVTPSAPDHTVKLFIVRNF
jgi:hypothetical protein